MVSQSRAAAAAGVSRADFIDALAFRRIAVAHLEPSDLNDEPGDG